MMSPADVLRQYPPHDGTLYGLLSSRAQIDPDRPCLLFNATVISWAEFKQRVDALAQSLQALGVCHGQRVAIASRNHPGFLVVIFALARLGAICVPVNHELGARELAYIFEHAQISGLIAPNELLPKAQQACQDLTPTPWQAVLNDQPACLTVLTATKPAPDAAGHTAVLTCGRAEDTWLIIYTSGSTGFPKGVMHAQKTFAFVGEAFVERMYLQGDERLLCILPLYHVNALFNSVGGAFAAGAALALVPRFSASSFWQVAAETRVTEVNMIASIGHILARRDASEFRPDHCISKIYNVPSSQEIAEIFHARFGVEHMIEGYGLSEAQGVITNSFQAPRIGSMGRPARHPLSEAPYAEIRLVDEQGVDVPVGDAGEILVRSPVVMQGYFRDPQQTQAAFLGDWFKTGDIARRDTEGYYYFIGRKKDIIRRRGENISAAEIERIVKLHPCVQDAAVMAYPSELGEDEILAIIQLIPGATLKEVEVADWCREHLASYKAPRYVKFIHEFPYTPSHRVMKHKLQADRDLMNSVIDVTMRAC